MTSRMDTLTSTEESAPGLRTCDHPECGDAGLYRAPRSRAALRDYYWFCRDHARAYNLEWNYYAGMSEEDVERERRGDAVWHRPTWPFGTGTQRDRLRDPFGLFEDGPNASADTASPGPTTPEEEAMAQLDLRPPLTLAGLKKRYKELVKRHHPDANGGDKAAEERLKTINRAYDLLQQAVTI